MNRAGHWIIGLAVALAAALPAVGDTLLFTGNDQAVWLIRAEPGAQNYDVLARQLDGEWKWVARDAGRVPLVAAALDDRLHVLFGQPLGYVCHDLRPGEPYDPRLDFAEPRRNPADPRWPDNAYPVTLCGAPGWSQASDAPPALLAVVSRTPEPTTTRPTTQPEDADAQAPALAPPSGKTVQLGVFLKLGSDWTYLADVPGLHTLPPKSPPLAAAVGQTLYVFIEHADGTNVLMTYGEGQWRTLPTDAWPQDATADELLAVDGRLLAVLTVPTQESDELTLHLAGWDPQAQRFDFQPVTQGDGPASWPAASPPLVAQLADRVALLWLADGTLRTATCPLNGQMLATTDLDLLTAEPADGRGAEIIQTFTMGLLIAMFVPLLLVRPPAPAKPFTLPPTMRPGDPIKRLIAATLDFIPCAAIAVMVFQVQIESIQELRKLQEMVERGVMPTNLAYAMITTLLLYTAYAIAMEWRFRATPGMMLFRLKVVGDGGTVPTARGLFLRNMFRILELMFTPYGIPWLLLMVFLTRYRQRVGDVFARTAVIDASYVPPPAPPQPDEPPQDLGPLPPEEPNEEEHHPTQGKE